MAEETRNWIRRVNDARQDLGDSVSRLQSLASAMDRIGLLAPARELYMIASDIDAASKEINKATNDELTSRAREAGRHVAETFVALVDGLKLNKPA